MSTTIWVNKSYSCESRNCITLAIVISSTNLGGGKSSNYSRFNSLNSFPIIIRPMPFIKSLISVPSFCCLALRISFLDFFFFGNFLKGNWLRLGSFNYEKLSFNIWFFEIRVRTLFKCQIWYELNNKKSESDAWEFGESGINFKFLLFFNYAISCSIISIFVL